VAVEAIDIPKDQIAAFCRRWKITELGLFGSVLQEDFGPESDTDVLVRFAPDHGWSLFDHVSMEEELEAIFGRKSSFDELTLRQAPLDSPMLNEL